MEDFFTTRLSPVLMGLCMGALMAFGVLILQDQGAAVFVTVVFALAAPACMDFVKKRGMSASIAETVMILVSLCICVLYCLKVARDAGTLRSMLVLNVGTHLLALVVNIVRITWSNRRKEADHDLG